MANIIDSKFFISYNHSDKKFANELFELFTKWKINCFIDELIPFEENFLSRITREIQTSTHIFVIISNNSKKSSWVGFETGAASGIQAKIIPILITPCELPTFIESSKYLSFTDEIDKIQLIKYLIELGLFEDGFVSKSLMLDYPHRFPNEVFAEEILTRPIQLFKCDGRTKVVINRNEVDYIIISNKGKDYFCKKHICDREKAKEMDAKIHDFQRNKTQDDNIVISTNQFPIRWVSGGVLSIVKDSNNKEWIPLFFRDIKPIGWNISLGGSERDFNYTNVNESLNHDLNSPFNVIIREFLEETLVLDKEPESNIPLNIMRFYWDRFVDIKEQREKAETFSRSHVYLREYKDLLAIVSNNNMSEHDKYLHFGIPADFVNTKTELSVIEGSGDFGIAEHNFLVAINILEIGIEIIKIVKYNIKDNYYFLDGEILRHSDGDEVLVRMPFALVSADFLRKKLIDLDISSKYSSEQQPSIVIEGTIDPSEVIVYEWDLKKRIEISSRTPVDREVERYISRQKQIGNEYFCDENNRITKNKLPLIFTPSTVKLLQYYFAL